MDVEGGVVHEQHQKNQIRGQEVELAEETVEGESQGDGYGEYQ